MREIKFRAWDETNKVMEYNVNVNQGKAVKYGYQWFNPGNTVYDSELMQYTGLKDKNGVEIYEGDIVENTTQIVYLGDKYEVVWNKNYACYQLMNNGFTSNVPLIQDLLTQDFMSYEVIGNIYEQEVE